MCKNDVKVNQIKFFVSVSVQYYNRMSQQWCKIKENKPLIAQKELFIS